MAPTLHSLIHTYLQASGGRATSRNVGRYLSKCSVSPGSPALAAMKDTYGGLLRFLQREGGGIKYGEGDGGETELWVESDRA